MLAVCRPEGSGSSPVGIELKENLLKVWSMKKQGNKWNAWSAELLDRKDRWKWMHTRNQPLLLWVKVPWLNKNMRDWWNGRHLRLLSVLITEIEHLDRKLLV